MEPYILEINKGPDMIPKDNKDKQLKTKVELDMLGLLGIIKPHKNEFYKIHQLK